MEEQANTQWGAKQDGRTVVAENVKPVRQFKTKTYKGVVMYDNEIEEIEKMDIRDNDVWVCSFPRSGNTQSMGGAPYITYSCTPNKDTGIENLILLRTPSNVIM